MARRVPVRQDGVILAMALMFLALLTATAAVGPGVAALELLRASSMDAWSRADAAATAGLEIALAQGELISTSPAVVVRGTLATAEYTVDSEFLGFRSATPAQPPGNLVEWHFLLTASGTAGRGARSLQALQVFILAPEPEDRDRCESAGCAVPRICAEALPCETGLRASPVPVGWHLPSEGS